MELMYLWINKSKNNILEKQEVNLTSRYNICYKAESNTITITENEDYYNIFRNDIITNVTAVVGANGVGKTTLLDYIVNNDVILPLEVKREGNQREIEEENETNQLIQVFENKGKLVVFHNLYRLETNSKATIIKVNNNVYKMMLNKKIYLNAVTRIYLTNGNYYNGKGASSSYAMANKIFLINESIKIFKEAFYEDCVKFPEALITDNYYNGLQRILISNQNEKDFKALCDVVYFNMLLVNNRIDSFSGKVSTILRINCKRLDSILNVVQKNVVLNYKTQYDYEKRIEEKRLLWRKYISELGDDIDYLNLKMKLNLIFEMDFIFDILTKDPIQGVINIDDIFITVKNILPKLCDKKYIGYYKNAIKEIELLEEILYGCELASSPYPKGDIGYRRDIVINYEEDVYKNFIKYIDAVAKAKWSFVLKYIHIDNVNMSSGERAYLNLFSWINLITFFKKIIHGNNEPIKDNILLVVDEIELYSHPEWQRKFIKSMLEELIQQFSDKKIQIIFATHSPIVLSDIPRTNTIYMKRDRDKKIVIENGDKHKETFAANIHKLFDDAFFLESKGAVGEFARDSVNDVFKKLKDAREGIILKETLDRKKVEFIIDNIGEPIVKNKLLDMYQEVYNQDEDRLLELQNRKIESLKAKVTDGKGINDVELIRFKEQLADMLAQVEELMRTGDENG